MRPALLISGGTGGIGRALARQAAAAGWRVLIGHGRGAEAAHALAADLPGAEAIALPLHDPAGLDTALARLADARWQIRAAALCASPPPPVKNLLKTGAADFTQQMAVSVQGHHRLLQGLWRHCFRPAGGGTVVGVLTAGLGPPPTPHMTAYLTAKAAFAQLLACWEAEYGPAGLVVRTVSPGFTDTPMLTAFPAPLLQRLRDQPGAIATADSVAAGILARLDGPHRAAAE